MLELWMERTYSQRDRRKFVIIPNRQGKNALDLGLLGIE